MNPKTVADRPPRQPRAIVLEDDAKTASELMAVLVDHFSAKVDVALDMKTYHMFVDQNAYEAASIDWEIRESVAGASALDAIRHSPAGCIVYTNYPTYTKEAYRYGANEVVEKRNIDEYIKAFERAVRYGFAREIVQRMKFPEKLAYPLTLDAEVRTCRAALNEAVRSRGTGRVDFVDLLKRRGWLSEASPFDLAKKPWAVRVRYLADLCETRTEQLANIVRAEPNELELRLQGAEPPVWSDPLVRLLDDLNSIFMYTFRIAGKHPELVRHYWTIQELFKHEESAPPWNRTGIADYLASTGRDGIGAALRWIRSH